MLIIIFHEKRQRHKWQLSKWNQEETYGCSKLEKENMFSQMRQMMNPGLKSITHHNTNSAHNSGHHSEAVDYFLQIANNNCTDPEAVLTKISEILTHAAPEDSHNTLTIVKLIDKSIHIYLMKNLENNTLVKSSLKLISQMVCIDKLKVANRFVSKGLLDYLIRYATENIEYINLCMNILGNVVV